MVTQTNDVVTVTTAKWNQSACRLISNESFELQPKTVLKSANFPHSLIIICQQNVWKK